MLELNKIHHGDCLELMKDIPDKSIDLILADLPYGTTSCKWDSIIPFEPLWEQYERIIKDNGAIVLTASQPFTSILITSNLKLFRYEWIWDKVNKYTNFANANKQPLKRHENICVFYKKLPTYNKQFRDGIPYKSKQTAKCYTNDKYLGKNGLTEKITVNDGKHNPCSVLEIKGDVKKESGLHPTQKPVALFEYLIKTYTNENETVLDNCIGSGTTAIAALNTGRFFIGIEQDAQYVEIANKRIQEAYECGKQ